MEHSDRGAYITHQVSVWIESDGQFYQSAVSIARNVGDRALRHYLITILRAATPKSAAWLMAQEMAPNDYDRVNWKEIRETLSAE